MSSDNQFRGNLFGENVAALFLLYGRPVAAISRILDHGRLWFAIIAALATSILLVNAQPPLSGWSPRPISHGMFQYLAPLLAMAVFAAPAVVLIHAIRGFGSFSVLMGRDYAPLLMCVLMAYAAAFLPVAIARWFLTDVSIAVVVLVSFAAYFGVLFVLVVRTFYGTGFGAAIGATILAAIATIGGTLLIPVVGPLLPFLGSPMILVLLYFAFGSRLRSLGDGLRSRQHLREQLEISTNNPRDADAHYQLGLIYQNRRQYTEAIARFKRAVEIDPAEADPHFQLGRIAREQKRTEEAIGYLSKAASLNDKLGQSDVWRELGAAYFQAGRLEEAAAALGKFTDRRPYDPEGLYWYGKTLAGLGRGGEAREMFERAIEAVKTMPRHRRAEVRTWGSAAKGELRKVG
jgi:Flp pilus assembly protein TadD